MTHDIQITDWSARIQKMNYGMRAWPCIPCWEENSKSQLVGHLTLCKECYELFAQEACPELPDYEDVRKAGDPYEGSSDGPATWTTKKVKITEEEVTQKKY